MNGTSTLPQKHAFLAAGKKECVSKCLNKPPRKLPELGFAGFEASCAAAGHGRRTGRWPLRPTQEPSDSQAADAGWFVKEAGRDDARPRAPQARGSYGTGKPKESKLYLRRVLPDA